MGRAPQKQVPKGTVPPLHDLRFLSQERKTDNQKQQNSACMIMLSGRRRLLSMNSQQGFPLFSPRSQLRGKSFVSFVSFFSGNPKEGRAKCPVGSHSSLSYLTSILLKLAQTFPSFSQESHFCFNFSVYPESVSGLSTARETPSKLAISTSLMNSRVPQLFGPYSPFKRAVPKPHIY